MRLDKKMTTTYTMVHDDGTVVTPIEQAKIEWEFFCKIYKSKSDEGGRVLVIKNLRKKND